MAFRWDQFEKVLKKCNPHFERFKKSSLRDLITLLKRRMPTPTAFEVQAEMKKVPAAKWKGRYKELHRYLEREFTIRHMAASAGPIGPSVPGYTPGKWERAKDKDGRWHQYVLQERGNSCGPACVCILKRSFYRLASNAVSEKYIRGLVALAETGKLYQGISPMSLQAVNAHDWKNAGANNGGLIDVLRSNPHPIVKARDGGGKSRDALLTELRKCTQHKPCIVGWLWNGGGGHWTVCNGPTKDGTELVILDPWDGIQYVKNTLAEFDSYQNGDGTLDFNDPVLTQ